jgi:hypothetical protein
MNKKISINKYNFMREIVNNLYNTKEMARMNLAYHIEQRMLACGQYGDPLLSSILDDFNTLRQQMDQIEKFIEKEIGSFINQENEEPV